MIFQKLRLIKDSTGNLYHQDAPGSPIVKIAFLNGTDQPPTIGAKFIKAELNRRRGRTRRRK